MTKDDTRLLAPIDLPAALGLLTRIPVKVDGARAMARGARAAWAYPVVGAILGAGAALLAAACMAAGLTAAITAALVLAFGTVITGAMHEDGLADTADGLWGGWDRARRLEIMKDSHIGVYGVCAVCLSLLLRWAALTATIDAGSYAAALITVGALGRAGMVVIMAMLPPARSDGLSRTVGCPTRGTMWLAVAIASGVATLAGFAVAVAIAGAMTLLCGWIAKAKIGGQTGDILGATQQVNEIALLATIVVLAP